MITSVLMPLLNTVERSPVPVLFALDEFAQLGRMKIIEDNIAQMRGYGVKLLTVWQFLTQAQRLYGEAWEAFFATSGANVTFAPRDATTREYFSKLSGEQLFRHETRSNSVNVSEGRTWGTSSSTGTSDNKGKSLGSSWGSNSGASNTAGREFSSGSSSGSNSGSNSGSSMTLGTSQNSGLSDGGSWSRSVNDSIGEQLISEPRVRTTELAALDADEALIFGRGGEIYKTLCPQPQWLRDDGVAEAIALARVWIETKPEKSNQLRGPNSEEAKPKER